MSAFLPRNSAGRESWVYKNTPGGCPSHCRWAWEKKMAYREFWKFFTWKSTGCYVFVFLRCFSNVAILFDFWLLSPNLFFLHLIWGVPWLWGSKLLLMSSTSFNSQLSKGKTTAEDQKCSTTTAGNNHRKISKCPFSAYSQVLLSDSYNTARGTVWGFVLKEFLKTCSKLIWCRFHVGSGNSQVSILMLGF